MQGICFTKKRISVYLSIVFILTGTISLFPSKTEAKIIKKTFQTEQVNTEEIFYYKNHSNPKLEKMSGGKSLSTPVLLGIAVVGVLIIVVAMNAAGG